MPRPYLSFSSMVLFERSPEAWADYYIYHKKQRISRNMAYGSKMAEGLENEEASGDPLLDLMMAKLPKFELKDKIVEDKEKGVEIKYEYDGKNYLIPFIESKLKGKKIKIPILAKPDTAKPDYSAFKEYKTSTRKWTQKMVDDSGQLTFYTTAIWLITKKIVKDIELINVPVEYLESFSVLQPTGQLVSFRTKRTMVDIIKMITRIKKAWTGMNQFCENELW